MYSDNCSCYTSESNSDIFVHFFFFLYWSRRQLFTVILHWIKANAASWYTWAIMYYPQGCYKQFKGNYNNQCVEESLPWASSKLCLHTPKTKTLFSTFQLHRFCILQPSPQNMYTCWSLDSLSVTHLWHLLLSMMWPCRSISQEWRKYSDPLFKSMSV